MDDDGHSYQAWRKNNKQTLSLSQLLLQVSLGKSCHGATGVGVSSSPCRLCQRWKGFDVGGDG